MTRIDASIFNQISDRYFGWHTPHFSRSWEYSWIASRLDLHPGIFVLDAGAGKSPLPFFCVERGALIFTVDNGRPNEAREWGYFDYGSVNSDMTSYNMDFTRLPWSNDQWFDYIISISIVEHMPASERRKAWQEFSRILKVGGKLVLTIDFQRDAFSLWNRSRGVKVEPDDEHGTVTSMLQELENVGFILKEHEMCPVTTEETLVGALLLEKVSCQTHGAKTKGAISKEHNQKIIQDVDRIPIHSAGRVAVGCVTENSPVSLSQVLRLLQSMRWFGGSMANVNFFICFVDKIDINYACELIQLGAFIRKVPRFSIHHPHSNKLCFFDLPEIKAYDTVMLIDCDTIIVQDPRPFLDGKNFQAKIAYLPTVPHEAFSRLFKHFGLLLPHSEYHCTSDGSPTIWYCNSGVLVFPVNLMIDIIPIWQDYNLKLSRNLNLLGPHKNFCDQASLSLAFAAKPVPFKELPVSMNFPLHLTNLETPPAMTGCDPIILHYHDRVDASGYLLPSPYPCAQKRIQLFNDRLRESRRRVIEPSSSSFRENREVDRAVVCMPICIAGMHRSGTSMVARMLNLCGLYLGKESEIMAPGPDNPEGFWENSRFVKLNDNILAQLGGAWDLPPVVTRGWELGPEFISINDRAEKLVEKFRGHGPWGWKDPRNSLTIPFWKSFFPELKVVICLRNPLDVARSLYKRGYSSNAFGFNLWLTYNQRLLSATCPEQRIITHYDSYFSNSRAELKRVVNFLCLPVSEEIIDRACEEISSSLRHNRTTKMDLLKAGVPSEVLQLYADMYAEAGPVCQQALTNEPLVLNDKGADKGQVPEKVINGLLSSGIDASTLSTTVRASIIIPVLNKLQYTRKCMQSIMANTTEGAYEIIFVDNGSWDETAEYLKNLDGPVRVIRNSQNLGFVKACNQGARIANGEYLVFLNNDTEPQPGWLDSLVDIADTHPKAGAVGVKLIYPDGRLQEAGGIIFSDGSGHNFGRGDDPKREVYNTLCEVDYCSGACLLVRRRIFESLGGFDERYSPAYYEETDLCFSIRKLGYCVIYNPDSTVMHHEFVTSGSRDSGGAKDYLKVNRERFVEKWSAELKMQEDPPGVTGKQPLSASRARLRPYRLPQPTITARHAKQILVFYPHNPWPVRTGSHRRCLAMLRAFKNLGVKIHLVSCTAFTDGPWSPDAQKILRDEFGIESSIYDPSAENQSVVRSQLKAPQQSGMAKYQLEGLNRFFKSKVFELRPDFVLINYAYWGYLASNFSSASCLKIIEMHDLVTLNDRMQKLAWQRIGNPPFATPAAEAILEDFYQQTSFEPDPREFKIYDDYELVLAISKKEAELVRRNVCKPLVETLPMAFEPIHLSNNYDGSPIFVIGANIFNFQGYLYLTGSILPQIIRRHSNICVEIFGDACRYLRPVAGTHLNGYQPDLKPFYAQAPFAVCPLIGGTGQQVKIVEAMAHGVPVIAMKNVAESSPIVHGENGFIAEDAKSFADWMQFCLENRDMCRKLGRKARETVETRLSEQGFQLKLESLLHRAVERKSQLMAQGPAAASKASIAEPQPERILWMRTDSIGDNILAAAMLPHIHEKYPGAKITVLCQEHIKELYEPLPWVASILAFNRRRTYSDRRYRSDLAAKLGALKADLTLNSVYSREAIGDFFAIASKAREIVGFNGDLCNISLQDRERANGSYTRLINLPGETALELDRHREFLKNLGINIAGLRPLLWLTAEDEKYADQVFEKNGFDPAKTVGLFAGAMAKQRLYPHYGKALSQICKDWGIQLIGLGAAADFHINAACLRQVDCPSINLSGETSLRQAAAILKRCRLGIGAETGLAHMACAMATPNVVLLGGGHFGRFMPYSALTTVACLPLSCFGCNWQCAYDRPHCVHDLPAAVLAEAVRLVLGSSADKIRIVIPIQSSRKQATRQPSWRLPDMVHDTGRYELVRINAITGKRLPIAMNSKIESPPTREKQDHDYLVSAVVSTYNAERFMRGCLEDLQNQTIADQLEIIVVDSGSRQAEGEIVQRFQRKYGNIKYIRTQERETVYAAWNRGIKAASGKYITNANIDDRHKRDAFEKMVSVLEMRPDVALVYADVIRTEKENQTFEDCTAVGEFHWYDWNREILLEKGCFIGPQPMWRRSVHDVYGYFDESLVSSGDYEFWLRISQSFNFHHIRMPLGLYLERQDSIEHREPDQKRKEDAKIRDLYKKARQEGKQIRCLSGQLEEDSMNKGQKVPPVLPRSTVHAKENIQRKSVLSSRDVPKTYQSRQGGHIVKHYEKMYAAIQPLLNNGRPEDAMAALENLVDAFPDFAKAHNDLGVLYFKAGQKERSLAHYEQAARLQPENITFQKNLADFYYVEQGRVEDALKIYIDILTAHPKDIETLLITGHICVALHKFDDAKAFYNRVLEIEPWNADARQFLDKLQSTGPAQNVVPQDPEEIYQQIQPVLNGEDPEAAISALEGLLEKFPDFALANNDLGVLYYNKGEKQKALGRYEKAAMLEPGNITFQKNLADFYYVEQGRLEDSLKIYVDVLAAYPEDVECLYTTGQICENLQHFDDALVFYRRILEIEPWNADARQRLDELSLQRKAG